MTKVTRPLLKSIELRDIYTCVVCKNLLKSPYQSTCGCRADYDCVKELSQKLENTLKENNAVGSSSIKCPGCGDVISLKKFFPDKAATRELNLLEVTCPNEGCTWSGLYQEYPNHYEVCPQARVDCPHEQCRDRIIRKNLERHVKKCGFRSEPCEWCGKNCTANSMKDHIERCDKVEVPCIKGCGEKIQRAMMSAHIEQECVQVHRKCRFSMLGCRFEGAGDAMRKHEESYVHYHLQMVMRRLNEVLNSNHQTVKNHEMPRIQMDHVDQALTHIDSRMNELTRQTGDNMMEVQRMKSEIQSRNVATEEAIGKLQLSLIHI